MTTKALAVLTAAGALSVALLLTGTSGPVSDRLARGGNIGSVIAKEGQLAGGVRGGLLAQERGGRSIDLGKLRGADIGKG
jgi:hypothetical protein